MGTAAMAAARTEDTTYLGARYRRVESLVLRRLGLSDFDQVLVAPFGIVDRASKLCWRVGSSR